MLLQRYRGAKGTQHTSSVPREHCPPSSQTPTVGLVLRVWSSCNGGHLQPVEVRGVQRSTSSAHPKTPAMTNLLRVVPRLRNPIEVNRLYLEQAGYGCTQGAPIQGNGRSQWFWSSKSYVGERLALVSFAVFCKNGKLKVGRSTWKVRSKWSFAHA